MTRYVLIRGHNGLCMLDRETGEREFVGRILRGLLDHRYFDTHTDPPMPQLTEDPLLEIARAPPMPGYYPPTAKRRRRRK